MKKIIYIPIFLAAILGTQNAVANVYKVPPSSTTRGSVPWISDQAMEACVKLYNEAEWLNGEMSSTYIDRYSQDSVDSYNNKVSQHTQMINNFNRNCAGKQSESAYNAAQKLNNK